MNTKNDHIVHRSDGAVTSNDFMAKEKQQKPKAKKLGRAARRRKNKVRAIDQALQNLLCGNDVQIDAMGDGDGSGGEGGGEDNGMKLSQLPSDRHRSLPGVLQRRREKNQEGSGISEIYNNPRADEAMLVSQLGYMPGNAIGVAGRTGHLKHLYPELHQVLRDIDAKRSHSHATHLKAVADLDRMPMALELYPLVERDTHQGGKSGRRFKSRKRGHSEIITKEQDDCKKKNEQEQPQRILEPFPTIYWLTHPFLRTIISQLELGTTHNVTQMEQKLSSSPMHLERMKTAHEWYGKHRWKLLTQDDVIMVKERKWTDAIGSVRGVAGIRKHETIKCLHTHAAHYLALLGNLYQSPKGAPQVGMGGTQEEEAVMEENIVGKWVLEAVNEAVKLMNINRKADDQP